MNSAVLVGGCADGRRVALPQHVNTVRIARLRPLARVAFDSVMGVRDTFAHSELYEAFWGFKGHLFLCPEGMPYETAMDLLHRGYQHEVQL